MSLSIALVCEAPADREMARTLTDRIIRHYIDWTDDDTIIESVTQYRGFRATDTHLEWKNVRHLADGYDILVRGKIGDQLPHPDAHAARRALLLLGRSPERPEAVFLIRDSDNDLTRRDGLNQARDSEPWPFAVVIGFAHTKRECWYIAGFEPRDDDEISRLDDLRQELGFNPCENSAELHAKHDAANDKRSAKRVLAALTGGDGERERTCLTKLSLGELVRRGQNNGLADFLKEVETRLLPSLGHHAPPVG